MFQSPAQNDSILYAEIPDTPSGPNEMLVSPLSGKKRKSTNLVGLRDLFKNKKSSTDVNLVGVKELYQQDKNADSSSNVNLVGIKELYPSGKAEAVVSPAGLKRILKTPKGKQETVSPRGLKRLTATPRSKKTLGSPAGLDTLFKSPILESPHITLDNPVPVEEPINGKHMFNFISEKKGRDFFTARGGFLI